MFVILSNGAILMIVISSNKVIVSNNWDKMINSMFLYWS